MNQTDTEPRVIRLPRRKHQVMDLAALGCLNSIIFRISIWTRALYGPPGPVRGAVNGTSLHLNVLFLPPQ